MGKLLIDKHRGKDENRVIYDVTWNTDTETNQYVLMTRLVSSLVAKERVFHMISRVHVTSFMSNIVIFTYFLYFNI